MNQIQDCYRGALIGAALGDALGATVDNLSRSEVKEKFGVHREIVGGGHLKLAAGDVGVDTRLAVAVAQSMAAENALSLKDVVTKLTAAFAEMKDGKGAGPTTREVMGQLKPRAKDHFAPAKKVYEKHGGDVAGAGCVVRVMPAGLLRRIMFKELVQDTISLCRLTHFDQRCVDACLAFNFGISYLTSGKDPSKLLFKTWRFLMDSRDGKDYKETVGEGLPQEDMVKGLKSVNDLQWDDLQSNGVAIPTVQAGYWLVLNAIDFEEGLVRAVNLGGDAATLGAVAGALLGARFGEAAIPSRWLEALEMREELKDVADQLCDLAEPKK